MKGLVRVYKEQDTLEQLQLALESNVLPEHRQNMGRSLERESHSIEAVYSSFSNTRNMIEQLRELDAKTNLEWEVALLHDLWLSLRDGNLAANVRRALFGCKDLNKIREEIANGEEIIISSEKNVCYAINAGEQYCK